MNRRLFLAIVGVLLVVGLTGPLNGFDNPNRMTYLTFNTPVALPGVTLPAGTYVFERATPDSTLNLIRVSSRDRKKVYLTRSTISVARPRNWSGDRQIVFAERKAGEVPRISVWYPIDTSIGHKFVY